MAKRKLTPAKHCDVARWHTQQLFDWCGGTAFVFLDREERYVIERAANQALDELAAIAEVLSGEYRWKKAERIKADARAASSGGDPRPDDGR